jgi:hypothetical protein
MRHYKRGPRKPFDLAGPKLDLVALAAQLTQLGFTHKTPGAAAIYATHETAGLRVESRLGQKTGAVFIDLKMRGERRNFTTLRCEPMSDNQRDDFVAALQAAITHPDVCPPALLPIPHQFKAAEFTIVQQRVFDGQNYVVAPTLTNTSQFASVAVIGVVVFGRSGDISFATAATHAAAQGWFILDCRGHADAVFNIVTDGNGFYVVRRLSEKETTTRIVNRLQQASVSIDHTTPADRRLVNAAIDDWTRRLTGGSAAPSSHWLLDKE